MKRNILVAIVLSMLLVSYAWGHYQANASALQTGDPNDPNLPDCEITMVMPNLVWMADDANDPNSPPIEPSE